MTTATLSTHAALPSVPGITIHHVLRRWLVFLAVVAAVGAGVALYLRAHPRVAPSPYLTAPVTRGEVVETVEATGNLQAVLSIQVGSQVSGRIVTLHVDFNSHVHTGDLLADIDPTPFNAAVAQAQGGVLAARATLLHARADLLLARQNAVRQQSLRAQRMNAVVDLETANDTLQGAQAQVRNAQAILDQAVAALDTSRTNLSYTHIHAPLDGVVVTRAVDVGQTVAAAFQAPTLFVIANDLRRMQVIGNVDEADVGRLRAGQSVAVHVDAFPTEVFQGTISQVRYQSTMIQGVVTYPAVIDVANPEQKLFPGMTATIDVVTARHPDVLRVPNAALRYRPNGVTARTTGARLEPRGGLGRIYVMRHGAPEARVVHTGITDGVYTEFGADGITAGEAVVTDQTDDAQRSSGHAASGSARGL